MTLRFTLLLLLFCSTLRGGEIDLKGQLPEKFDWNAYFEEGDQSTTGQMFLAEAAAKLLKTRIDQLCTECRRRMRKQGEEEAVKLFDEMQANWEKAADAEMRLVGSSLSVGLRDVYPMHLFKMYLSRVKELVELQSDCQYMNE